MSPASCQFSRIAGAVDVIVIGAGHAGLAISRLLADDGVDHVVLERGEIGNAWRERWESLTLLTPNWQTRLPGQPYEGDDPEGFMSTGDLVRLLENHQDLRLRLFQVDIRHDDIHSCSRSGPRNPFTDA